MQEFHFQNYLLLAIRYIFLSNIESNNPFLSCLPTSPLLKCFLRRRPPSTITFLLPSAKREVSADKLVDETGIGHYPLNPASVSYLT